MSFLKDMFAVSKKRNLTFIESIQEAEHVYSFLFQKEDDLTWDAGQYGLFSITHKKIKNATRPFSISSAPGEDVVRITTRISHQPSEFKKALQELKQGMTIKMGGPVGSFKLSETTPSLLIAAGIGITPFRSMLMQLSSQGKGSTSTLQLLYVDSQGKFLFQDELNKLAEALSIRIVYLHKRDDLHEEINKYSELHKNQAEYYVAGPKSMIDNITAQLTELQIPKRQLKKDVFY